MKINAWIQSNWRFRIFDGWNLNISMVSWWIGWWLAKVNDQYQDLLISDPSLQTWLLDRWLKTNIFEKNGKTSQHSNCQPILIFGWKSSQPNKLQFVVWPHSCREFLTTEIFLFGLPRVRCEMRKCCHWRFARDHHILSKIGPRTGGSDGTPLKTIESIILLMHFHLLYFVVVLEREPLETSVRSARCNWEKLHFLFLLGQASVPAPLFYPGNVAKLDITERRLLQFLTLIHFLRHLFIPSQARRILHVCHCIWNMIWRQQAVRRILQSFQNAWIITVVPGVFVFCHLLRVSRTFVNKSVQWFFCVQWWMLCGGPVLGAGGALKKIYLQICVYKSFHLGIFRPCRVVDRVGGCQPCFLFPRVVQPMSRVLVTTECCDRMIPHMSWPTYLTRFLYAPTDGCHIAKQVPMLLTYDS